MITRQISSGSAFEAVAGYSRALVVEHATHAEVFVSGCTGFNYADTTISPDVGDQARQCFVNIAAALAQAGGEIRHIVRVRYYFTDGADWQSVAPIFGQCLAPARPAATALICGLVDPRMKIEIEVEARIPLGAGQAG
jgi:enamine deaminase RidA (YjgF/YER057c/UK114 family)